MFVKLRSAREYSLTFRASFASCHLLPANPARHFFFSTHTDFNATLTGVNKSVNRAPEFVLLTDAGMRAAKVETCHALQGQRARYLAVG